ncbi:MAG: site-specific DNA-methyltransferase [Gammaproteobacteria bacterium]|nr:site-specific DNA-methyltransferase [Gammaproteobacteria bacterium]
MTTDPGDLVLDPTCGAGTAAYVAEQWGRRWITIDTSRVALALARARLMGARYPFYVLSDSPEGRQQQADLSHLEPPDAPTYGDVRQGFVYERVPHITLRSIANNAEIDVIYERLQPAVEGALADLNAALRGGGLAAICGRRWRPEGTAGRLPPSSRCHGLAAVGRGRACERSAGMGGAARAARRVAGRCRRAARAVLAGSP